MFLARQRNKIGESVIGFNSIEMMNNPSLGELFVISLLPNITMFKNSLLESSTLIIWDTDYYISIHNISAPLSSWTLLAPFVFALTRITSSCSFGNWFATIEARMVSFRPIFCPFITFHNYIIPYLLMAIKQGKKTLGELAKRYGKV